MQTLLSQVRGFKATGSTPGRGSEELPRIGQCTRAGMWPIWSERLGRDSSVHGSHTAWPCFSIWLLQSMFSSRGARISFLWLQKMCPCWPGTLDRIWRTRWALVNGRRCLDLQMRMAERQGQVRNAVIAQPCSAVGWKESEAWPGPPRIREKLQSNRF